MPVHRLHAILAALAAASLAACASGPPAESPGDGSVPAARLVLAPAAGPDFLRVTMDGALPLLEEELEGDAVVASKLTVGADERLRYQASYLLDANGILAAVDDESPTLAAPARFGGQHLGQKLQLQLPDIAGAPLSLAVTNELADNWMNADDGHARRELASFSWSPGRATVDVQWTGEGPDIDDSPALRCNFRSAVSLPTHEKGGRSRDLRISGRDCVVTADDGPWAGTRAHKWGLSYVWRGRTRESAAELAVVDPAWQSAATLPFDAGPGYELGLRHRREFASLTASGTVLLRRSQMLRNLPSLPLPDENAGVTDTSWAANGSLTWHLPQASLTANWARGVDPLWFTPAPARRGDRFGLAVNLSHWLEDYEVGPAPQLAMNWNWSELRTPGEERIASNSLSLDVAVVF